MPAPENPSVQPVRGLQAIVRLYSPFLPASPSVAAAASTFVVAATFLLSSGTLAQDTASDPIVPSAEAEAVETAPLPVLPSTGEAPGDEDIIVIEPDEAGGEPSFAAPGPDPDAGEAGSDAVSVTLSADGRFLECPDQLLREGWASILSEEALETFAVEEEVLRMCERRQGLINRIVRQEAEMYLLLEELPRRQPGGDAAFGQPVTADPAPTPVTDPVVAQPASPASGATSGSDPFPVPSAEAAPTAIAARAAVPAAGHWTHLVRYRVRVGDGAWRAGVASIWTPPPPPPVVMEDGTVIPGARPEPDPPLVSVVAAGGELPGGLLVAGVDDEAVLVVDPRGSAEARALRNDPGPAEPRAAATNCPTVGTDPRDFTHCEVTR